MSQKNLSKFHLSLAATLGISAFAMGWYGHQSAQPAPVNTAQIDDEEATVVATASRSPAALGSAPSQVHESSPTKNALTNLVSELRALKSEVADLRNTQPVVPQQMEVQPTAPNDEAAQEDTVLNEMEEQVALFDERMAGETSSAWSAEATEELTAELTTFSDAFHANEIRCAETLCRVALDVVDTESEPEDLGWAVTRLSWPGQMYVSQDPETGAALLYLSRAGSKLPKISHH